MAPIMTIEDYIAFLDRVPILRRLGAGALRIHPAFLKSTRHHHFCVSKPDIFGVNAKVVPRRAV